MPRSKTLEKLVRDDSRFDSYEYTDGDDSPHRLYLSRGWKSSADSVGVVHSGTGRTVRECIEDSRPIPCNCDDCKSL